MAIFEGAVAGKAGPTPELFLQAGTLDEPVYSSPEAYAQVLDGQNVFSPQIEQNDQSFEIYSTPLLDFSGNVIGVVEVVKDRAPLISQQTDRNLYFVISTLAILVVTSIGLGYITQRMLRPIGRLTETATAIAAGNFDNVVPVKGNDEIGMMAAAFNTMTTQLRNLIGSLEQRVQERTRDLALAAEVGRNLAQVRDLDTLLEDASELIRERFNLYHVQIYLTDSTQQILILRAGTGQAARELLDRHHSLAIAPGSINGSTALNKKSVIVADTRENSMFRPNPLLPDTRSEMAVPLLIGDRVLGVLDLQSAEVNSFTEEALLAFETLASQLAVAIDNANLFTSARQAQAEVEAHLQRLSREGWSNYLDGINREEKLAYIYEAREATAESIDGIVPISADRNALELPITVANEPIGTIQVEADDGRHWTEKSLSLVSSVAQQVAQQVENLRLLDEAQQYRLEAEEAVQRLTREGWQAYEEHLALPGFVYDGTEVKPLAAGQEEGDSDQTVSLPLQVRGQAIGQLVLAGVNDVDEETQVLLTAVAQQLSDHIENLRLAQQTELALAQTEDQARRLAHLNEMADALSAAETLDDVFPALQPSTWDRYCQP